MKSEKAKVYIEDKFISEYNDVERHLVHFGEDGIVLEKGRIGRCRRYADKAIELAEQEAEERLTRWNDPKEVLPDDKQVLVKTRVQLYDIAYYDRGFNRWFTGDGAYEPSEIAGWRKIE